MKKYNLILTALCAVLLGVSCSLEEGDKSTITDVTPFNVASITSELTAVPEEDGTHTVNFEIDNNLIFDGVLNIRVGSESTATEGVDFVLNDSELDLHPYDTKGSFTYTVMPDVLLEGDEKIVFELSTASDPYFVGDVSKMEVTITDFLTDALFLGFDWDVSFVFDGTNYHACQFVDLDVYVLDMEGNDLGIYGAATGACPEQLVIDDTWEDGTYFLASNMWDNAVLKPLIDGLEYTLTMSAYRQGKIDASYVPEDHWISNDDDQANDANASFKEVAILTVSGNTYTVEAPDGSLIGSGVKAPNKLNFK